MMTQDQLDTEQKPFAGDRYERVRQAAELLATDPSVSAGQSPFDAEGLRAFAATIHQLDLFAGLTDDDADFAAMLLLLDFPRGPQQMGWRVGNLLSERPDVPHEYDNELAVIVAYVDTLNMVLTAFLGADPRRALSRLAADAADVYDMVKKEPGNAGDYLLATRDSIADAIGALGK